MVRIVIVDRDFDVVKATTGILVEEERQVEPTFNYEDGMGWVERKIHLIPSRHAG